MKYESIKNYFDNGLGGIEDFMELEEIKSIIYSIEDYREQFKGNQLIEEAGLREALNVLTGLHGDAIVIAKVSETYTEANKAKELLLAKSTLIEDEKGNKKTPTDEVAKSIAITKNLPFARLSNLFEAYYKDCNQMIMTCQSQLNYLKKPIPSQE